MRSLPSAGLPKAGRTDCVNGLPLTARMLLDCIRTLPAFAVAAQEPEAVQGTGICLSAAVKAASGDKQRQQVAAAQETGHSELGAAAGCISDIDQRRWAAKRSSRA